MIRMALRFTWRAIFPILVSGISLFHIVLWCAGHLPWAWLSALPFLNLLFWGYHLRSYFKVEKSTCKGCNRRSRFKLGDECACGETPIEPAVQESADAQESSYCFGCGRNIDSQLISNCCDIVYNCSVDANWVDLEKQQLIVWEHGQTKCCSSSIIADVSSMRMIGPGPERLTGKVFHTFNELVPLEQARKIFKNRAFI